MILSQLQLKFTVTITPNRLNVCPFRATTNGVIIVHSFTTTDILAKSQLQRMTIKWPETLDSKTTMPTLRTYLSLSQVLS